ncbi:ABC transporter permease [Sutcliffiella halmapala]|uniref:ABC transporter permease n=1 Tax=Sutcliffiella halmapala TaxID=79882 RepID=UPI00099571C8|nr:ABC transporter permease [Sutcliffiella halmapala]
MRIVALIKRICQQMLRDKRTLALLFVAPLLILSLMYALFSGEGADLKLGVSNIDAELVQVLEDANIIIEVYENETGLNETEAIVVEGDLDGFLRMEQEEYALTIQNTDPASAKRLEMIVNQAVAAQAQLKLIEQLPVTIEMMQEGIATSYVYGSSDTEFFDVLSPILVGFFVFFFVFLISGIGLLKERTSGTLDRLMATPIRRGEIVTAYLIGFGIFAVIQTIIVVFFSVTLLDMVLVGSIWNVILINLLLALVALSLGTLLSTFAASEFQMVQFIPVAVIPQVFFSGIIPIDGMVDWLQALGKIMPLYYGANALKGVMYQGLTLSDISGEILALVVFAVLFITLNVFALKRYRKL